FPASRRLLAGPQRVVVARSTAHPGRAPAGLLAVLRRAVHHLSGLLAAAIAVLRRAGTVLRIFPPADRSPVLQSQRQTDHPPAYGVDRGDRRQRPPYRGSGSCL